MRRENESYVAEGCVTLVKRRDMPLNRPVPSDDTTGSNETTIVVATGNIRTAFWAAVGAFLHHLRRAGGTSLRTKLC
jgi:hypothetical protein